MMCLKYPQAIFYCVKNKILIQDNNQYPHQSKKLQLNSSLLPHLILGIKFCCNERMTSLQIMPHTSLQLLCLKPMVEHNVKRVNFFAE